HLLLPDPADEPDHDHLRARLRAGRWRTRSRLDLGRDQGSLPVTTRRGPNFARSGTSGAARAGVLRSVARGGLSRSNSAASEASERYDQLSSLDRLREQRVEPGFTD